MKRVLLSCVILATSPLGAQTITLKDGKTVPGMDLKRSGDSIISTIKVGTGQGTVGYPISNIAKISFPEPPELKEAKTLLAEGKAAAALAKIEPTITSQLQFRSLPGNWWAPAADIKLTGLIALRRDDDAGKVAAEILATSKNPEALRSAQLANAFSLNRKGEYEESLKVLEPILDQSRSKETLAAVWVCAGDNRRALKQNAAAVRAYLHVPIFYPRQALWMPAALLGSARSFEALEDYKRAKESITKLQADYPNSPDAGPAVNDLTRIDRKLRTSAATTSN